MKGKMPLKCIKKKISSNRPFIVFYTQKKNNQKKFMCAVTLPKIFRLITRNTYFFIWPEIDAALQRMWRLIIGIHSKTAINLNFDIPMFLY